MFWRKRSKPRRPRGGVMGGLSDALDDMYIRDLNELRGGDVNYSDFTAGDRVELKGEQIYMGSPCRDVPPKSNGVVVETDHPQHFDEPHVLVKFDYSDHKNWCQESGLRLEIHEVTADEEAEAIRSILGKP